MRGRRCALGGLGATTAALALSLSPDAGARVLPPAAGKLVFEALRSAGPAYPIASARIEGDHVWASLCHHGDPTRCFSIALGDPASGCSGAVAGPWCVTYPDGPPPEEARAPLVAALGALREDALWSLPEAAPPRAEAPGGTGAPTPPPPRVAHPVALAVALVLGPLALGVALGAALGRLLAGLGRLRVVARVALALLPLAAGVIALPWLRRVAAWDLLAPALLVGVGLAGGSARLPFRALVPRLALALLASLGALGALEVLSRALPAPAATFPPPEQVHLVFEAAPGVQACAPIYPEADPTAFAARSAAVRPGAPLVLHVGDSMVEGVGVAPEQAFPALLGRAQPGIDHVNAGFASTSLDFELLLTRAWLPRLAASRVVLYVFGYNDLSELDRASPCCRGGPLLDASGDARCAAPGLPSGRLALLAVSPAPYPARVATASSVLARRAVLGLDGLPEALARRRRAPASGPGDRWDRYALLLRALAADLARRHVPLDVVYLPARASLEDPAPRSTGDYALRGRVLELARAVGARPIDPWELLESAVRDHGAARWYLPPPDIHFTPEGHRLLAAWLDAGALKP